MRGRSPKMTGVVSFCRVGISSKLRRLKRRVRDSSPLLSLMGFTVGFAVSRGTKMIERESPNGVVFVAPPCGGNAGDQAMLESFCQNVSGRLFVVNDSRATHGIVRPSSRLFSQTTLRGVHSGSVFTQTRAMRIIGKQAFRDGFLVVAGADFIDGVYHARSAIALWSLLASAQRNGVDCRVVGFSWSDAVLPQVARAARLASEAGVKFVSRDSVSSSRLVRAKISPVVVGADMVFARSQIEKPSSSIFPTASRFAAVNVNALVSATIDSQSYLDVLQHLRSRGLAILLLPHATVDVSCVKALAHHAAQAGIGGISCIERLPTPDEVIEVCERAVVTLTARMHLSILSMVAGTPAIAVSYNGKVAGMMEMMGVPERCISPDALSSPSTLGVIDSCIDDSRMVIERRVDVSRARELAMLNFVGLPSECAE